MATSIAPRTALRAALATTVSAALLLGTAGTAVAAPPAGAARSAAPGCAGRGVPDSKVSIQLWTFAGYVGFGTDAATLTRLRTVLSALSEMGYRNVEPFTLSGLTAEQYADLLQEHGLKASARHVDVGTPADPADLAQILEENRILGIKHFGSGGTPDFATEAEWTAYARYLDEVGEQARKAGQTLMVHNHDWEFTDVFGDRTAYDILLEHTDRRNVVFQLDLYWASFAGVDPVDLLAEHGNRIQLFHVKDLRAADRRIEIVGRGVLDFPEVFAAGGGSTRYFVVEHDPRFGDPSFDPFVAAEEGFDHLDCVTF
jgi:sugar phosphate isomerase/epimerase